MKQHPFGDSENTFNFLKRMFKLRMKKSYFLNIAREVPNFRVFSSLCFPTFGLNMVFTLSIFKFSLNMKKYGLEKSSELGQFPHSKVLYETLITSDLIGLMHARKRSYYFK